MNRWMKVGASVVSACAMAAISLSAGPAHADPIEDPGYVIVDAEDAVEVGDAIFYPTGPIDEDTLVVIPDELGNLPGGVSEEQVSEFAEARRAGAEAAPAAEPIAFAGDAGGVTPSAVSGGWQWGAPLGGVWGSVFKTTTGYAGVSGSRFKYTFGVTESTNQQAVGRGEGHYRGYNGSEFGIWSKWYTIGTATASKNASATVPWGNTWAVGVFQGKSTILVHVAQGRFVCHVV